MTPDRPRAVLWALALAAVLAAAGQFNHDLWTPDEPRVAAIMLEMRNTGDWVVPHLAGEPFIEKPPLYFLLGALSNKAFAGLVGNLAALRLVNVLLALGTLAFVHAIAATLYDRRTALWAAIVLGTSVGFVSNSFWLRVDAALLFFTTAGLWAFCRGYLRGSRGALVGGGALTAAAFLTKGPIGPLTMFLPWLALFAGAWGRNGPARREPGKFWLTHAASLICFAIPAGGWMAALRFGAGGEQLWHEWFWQNQMGRLLGSEDQLGHIRASPLYYVAYLVPYLLPWLPLVALRIGRDAVELARRRKIPFERALPYAWGIGGLVLLSASATKRPIYLLPILPAFALMAASVATTRLAGWVRYWAAAWAAFALGASLLLASGPLSALWLPAGVPRPVAVALSAMGPWKIAAVLVAIVPAWVACRMAWKGRPLLLLAFSSAVLFWIALTVAVPALDPAKPLGEETRRLLAAIPVEERARVAAFDFGETERGVFYFYGDWEIARLTDLSQVVAVLEGRDRRYDGVVVNWPRGVDELFEQGGVEPPPPYRVQLEVHPRGDPDKGRFYWLTARPSAGAEPPS